RRLPWPRRPRPRGGVHQATVDLPPGRRAVTLTSYIFGIASALLILIVVIEMLRRHLLRERHAIWWFIAGVMALVAGIFPATLEWVSDVIGIEVPINLVFFVSITILFFVCL